MAYAVRQLVLELQFPQVVTELLVAKLKDAGLDQAIDLAMITDGDMVELVGTDVELEPMVKLVWWC